MLAHRPGDQEAVEAGEYVELQQACFGFGRLKGFWPRGSATADRGTRLGFARGWLTVWQPPADPVAGAGRRCPAAELPSPAGAHISYGHASEHWLRPWAGPSYHYRNIALPTSLPRG